MELRHLRYFVAVAEAGSLTVAAARELHTSQPSLSRQIRDLEATVGTQLLTRRARGIDLTPAGRAFLDHARAALSQVEAAAEAARRVAHPAKPCFSTAFLTGHELTWMPEALRILRDELPNIDVMISSQYSPRLGINSALMMLVSFLWSKWFGLRFDLRGRRFGNRSKSSARRARRSVRDSSCKRGT